MPSRRCEESRMENSFRANSVNEAKKGKKGDLTRILSI